MRFKKFLVEHGYMHDDIRRALDSLLPACKPFIEENKASILSGRFLLRGMKQFENNSGVGRKETRPDRKPRDTSKEIHNKIGVFFKNKFKVNYRTDNVIFVRQENVDLVEYGPVHIVFPEGNKYKMCYSPNTADLTATIDPYLDDGAELTFKKFITEHSSRYLPRSQFNFNELPANMSQATIMSLLFFNLYWYSAEDEISDLDEDFTKEDINRYFYGTYSSKKELNDFFEAVDYLFKKTDVPFMSFLLSIFGFKNIADFKRTLAAIGFDFMESLKYRENTKYLGFKPFANEIMLQCKSYVAIPEKYKKVLFEYINEKL